MAKAKTNKRYVVIPRNQETYKEQFAIANGKRVPFETPVVLSSNDVAALESQKEPMQIDGQMSVFDVMDKYRVPKDEAMKIMEAQAGHNMGGQIVWKPKYIVQAA